ncbi:MAG: response regulator transcription factor [Treponema sp.]|nr:response regulator transcription factor [Candidatus Treponema equifaecale]
MKNTLFIVDDHLIVSKGLKTWIESNSHWTVMDIAGDSEETLFKLENCPKENLPEVVIFDVQLKEEQSFDLIKAVLKKFPEIKAVVYSMFEITGYAMLAKECGAMGYVSKAASEEEFLKCLETVQRGEEYIQQNLVPRIEKAFDAARFLTKRERRVFEEIINGSTNEQVAKNLNIGMHTAEIYVSRIFMKLGVRYREDLIEMYK